MISFIKVAILYIINKGRLNENKKNVESHCIWTKRVNPELKVCVRLLLRARSPCRLPTAAVLYVISQLCFTTNTSRYWYWLTSFASYILWVWSCMCNNRLAEASPRHSLSEWLDLSLRCSHVRISYHVWDIINETKQLLCPSCVHDQLLHH